MLHNINGIYSTRFTFNNILKKRINNSRGGKCTSVNYYIKIIKFLSVAAGALLSMPMSISPIPSFFRDAGS